MFSSQLKINKMVNLEKGQKVKLTKNDGTAFTSGFMGLGWDVSQGLLGSIFGSSDSIDLDASVICFDENKNVIDTVSFRKLTSNCQGIKHSGDNRTGAGEGDDEVIKFDLTRLNTQITTLVFVVNSYVGQTFDKVNRCFARLVDSNNQEVMKFEMKEKHPNTGFIMCKVYKHNHEWKIAALGIQCNGRVAADIINDAKNAI